MESKRNSNIENNREDEQELEQENNEILKRRISTHPLYGMLVEAHLDCLKVGDISNLEGEVKKDNEMEATKKQNLGMFNHSELDLFMEAYCMALGKLKEAIEEPQQTSMAFINNMHSQLMELTTNTTHSQPPPPTTSSTDQCNLITRN